MKHSSIVSAAVGSFLCLGIIVQSVSVLAETHRAAAGEPEQISTTEAAAALQELTAFANVRVSMLDAIAIAEKMAEAKVVDVSFDGNAEHPAYRIKAYQGRKIWNGTIDASSGSVMQNPTLTPVSTLDEIDKVELEGFARAGITLSRAVEIAEKYAFGRAVSGGLAEADGGLIFLVVVVADDRLKEVSIDPSAN